MATTRKTSSKEVNHLRVILAVLLAFALAAGPLLYYTPTALGGEGKTANVKVTAANAQVLANGKAVTAGINAIEADKDLSLQVAPEAGFQVFDITAKDAAGIPVNCTPSGGGYLIAKSSVADGLAIDIATEALPAETVPEPTTDTGQPQGIETTESGVVEGGEGAAGPQAAEAQTGEGASTGFRLLAAAPENLFTINAAGTITYFAYNSADPIKNLEIPATIGGVTVTGIGNNVFAGCQLESVIMPATVKTLGTSAFSGNPLTSVTYSGGTSQMTTIGTSAFQNCTKLTSAGFTIPNTVTSIGGGAFQGCSLLDSVVIPAGVTAIGNTTFSGCGKLASVSLPAGLISIGLQAFSACPLLTSLTLPSTLQSIGYQAFYGAGLQSLTIPASVQTIDVGAFAAQTSSTSFKLYLPNHYPDSITGKPWGASTQYIYWKSNANSCFDITAAGLIAGIKPPDHDGGTCANPTWHQAGKGNIIIPKQVGSISVTGLIPSAFLSNNNIKTVAFESGCTITSIPKEAFASCQSLTSITLPPTIGSIGESAFVGAGLTSVTLPASVAQVGENAFHQNGNLATVTFEGNNAGLTIAENAFPTTEKFKNVYLSGHTYDSVAGQPWKGQYAAIHWADQTYDPEVIITPDGWHYNRVTKLLVKYDGPTGATVDVVVPKTITYNGTDYTVEEPISTPVLYQKTFRKITISEGFTGTGWGAHFANGAIIDEVVLPSTMTQIPQLAFNGTTLKKINFPEGLRTISPSAFAGCTQLTDMENFLPTTIVTISSGAFANVPLKIDALELPPGVTSIGTEAFKNCQLTGEIRIPSSVSSLGATAFNDNPGITSFYIDQFRANCPATLKNNQPWTNNNNVNVYYKGEVPLLGAVEAADASLTNTPLTKVNFSTHLEKDGSGNTVPGFKLEGAWICEGDVDTFPASATRIYNAATDGVKTEITDMSFALPNGTYTFWVSTNMMTKNAGADVDPSQYRRCTITIDKTLPLAVDADDFNVRSTELSTMTSAIALTKSNAASTEPCYNNAGTNSVSTADINKIKALSGHGSSTTITVNGTYSGSYTYTGSLLHPFGTVYSYTCTGSESVTVTLSEMFTVTFEEGAHGTVAGGTNGKVVHDGLAHSAPMPAAPAVTPDSGYTFTGWKNKATNVVYNAGNPLPATVTADATYEAQYGTITYNITYDFDGGTGPATANPATYTVESAPITLNNPTRSGYSFAGWTGANGSTPQTAVTIATGSTGDRAYKANWSALSGIAYKVEHYLQKTDGTYPTTPGAGNTDTLLGSTGATVNAVARTVTNYQENKTHGSRVPSGTVAADGSLVLKLYYSLNNYKVAYDGNGSTSGTAPADSTAAYLGVETTVAGKGTLARTGYTFKGWAANASATTAAYAGGATLEPLADGIALGTAAATPPNHTVTLYAVWEADTYDITYDFNGGTGPATANPATYTVETATFTLNNPTRTGYTFAGWTGANGSTAQTSVSVAQGSTGDKSYTANWTANSYTVVYNTNTKDTDGTNLVNSVTGSMAYTSHVYDTTSLLRENAYECSGYRFAGWNTAANGSGTAYADEASVLNLTSTPNGSVTLYAQWTTADAYTITYLLFGGTVTPSNANPASYLVTTATFTLVNPTKTGYTFAGWTGANGSTPQTSVSVAQGSTGDKIFTANWTANTYTVAYAKNTVDKSGATLVNPVTGTMVPSDHVYDVAKDLTENDYECAGYTFKGWNTAANGSGTAYADKASVTNLAAASGGSVTLYAQWQIDGDYSISYDLKGGTVSPAGANPVSYAVDTTTFTLVNPTKQGYSFAGWTGTGISGASTTVTVAKGSTGDRSYTATWTPASVGYTVNHYQEQLDGTYVLEGTQTPSALTESTVTAVPWTSATHVSYLYHGHSVLHPGNQLTGTVAADGSTVLSVYYDLARYELSFSSNGAKNASAYDGLELTLPVTQPIMGATGFPADDPAKDGHVFRGWQLPDSSWLLSTNTMPANDLLLSAGWERGTVVSDGDIVIVASDFVMSMPEAQAHQAKTPSQQMQELIARGFAKAWWKDTKEEVDITAIKVVPSKGNGTSIDAALGSYTVTYYAVDALSGKQNEVSVNSMVFENTAPGAGGIAGNNFTYNVAGGTLSEAQVRSLANVTVFDEWGSKSTELGRINADDLARLNGAISAGQAGTITVRFTNAAGNEVSILVTLTRDPDVPGVPGGGGSSIIYGLVYPLAQAMQGAVEAVAGPLYTAPIDDAGTPLSGEHFCWVHFYIILGIVITLVYSVVVVLRRRKFTNDLENFEDSAFGNPPAAPYRGTPGVNVPRGQRTGA